MLLSPPSQTHRLPTLVLYLFTGTSMASRTPREPCTRRRIQVIEINPNHHYRHTNSPKPILWDQAMPVPLQSILRRAMGVHSRGLLLTMSIPAHMVERTAHRIPIPNMLEFDNIHLLHRMSMASHIIETILGVPGRAPRWRIRRPIGLQWTPTCLPRTRLVPHKPKVPPNEWERASTFHVIITTHLRYASMRMVG